MKTFGRKAALAAGAVLCLTATQAFAGFEAVGSAEEGNSWSQGFVIDITNIVVNPMNYSFDRMELTLQPGSGSDFDHHLTLLSITNFTVGTNWSQDAGGQSATFVSASGDLGQELGFKVHFTDPITDGAHFHAKWYDGTKVTASGTATGTWNGTDVTWNTTFRAVVIPLPPAAWSGLAMIGALGAFVAKRRRDRSVL